MEDKDIIALYWERSERAIEETDIKYGKLCRSISMGQLAGGMEYAAAAVAEAF